MTPSMKMLILPFVVLLLHTVLASDYDPHIYPAKGPFFEGWYSRLTDEKTAASFGILFGRVLPTDFPPSKEVDHPELTYLTLIRSNGTNHSMVAVETIPELKDIFISVKDGNKPITNPDTLSPSDFQWVSRQNGYFNVTPTGGTTFSMTVNDIQFQGTFGAPVPWAPRGLGPTGWLHNFPLPLHWFVYSVATPGSYRWVNLTSQEVLQGKGYLHQEKNWGNSFPPEWIWTQGYDPSQNISFTGSFGTVYFGPIPVPALLFGYRNFEENFAIDFRPDNSVFSSSLDPCGGTASITVRSFWYTVNLDISAEGSTFGTCLCGPVSSGFVPIVTESFVATVHLRVKQHSTLWDTIYRSGEVIEDVTLEGVALEFGGDYMCPNNPCVTKTTCG